MSNNLIECRRCNQLKAPVKMCKSKGNTSLCYECKRESENARRGAKYEQIEMMSAQEAEQRLMQLRRTPEYRAYYEDWKDRAAQWGTASRRGVGVIDV